ncbi:MAG: recombinase family protein [Sedimentisphaerales bacterium]|nr:recombinase family protein [Sedimentisphaerales bacterium]
MKDPRAKIIERLVDGPPKPRPIRYAIYTRQSVDKLADFSSCQAQFDTCRDFARAGGERGLAWCGQHFDDEGQSGATLDRPGIWMNSTRRAWKFDLFTSRS